MNKLLLIDGNAIIHRAYHALPPLTSNNTHEPINAVYGFISMLLRVTETLKPTHIIVAWDTPKPTFRHAEYSNYQAQRPKGESDFTSQFALTHKVLEAMNIPQYSMKGFEADDVIGTIANQATKDNKTEVVIVTGDRDILQLVDDGKHISLYMPIKGLANAKQYFEKDVVERMGVKANQIIDYKALVGDPSDNYPGVAGIGEKTAIDLLKQFGTVDEIYKNLHLVPDRYAKKLAEGVEPAGISRKLATIVQDVPITCDFDRASKWDVSSLETVNLFKQIGFKTLTNRIQNFKK